LSAALARTHSIRAAAVLLAIAVLIGGMPLSMPAMRQRREAAFTLDICHPAQTWTFSPISVIAVFPDRPAATPPFLQRKIPATRLTLKIRDADAPDPPPPKVLA
jgi:hypothetical protein